MLNNNYKSFLLKFYSLSCCVDIHVDVKQFYIEYKNDERRLVDIKVKCDEDSSWNFSKATSSDLYKSFNGFITEKVDVKSDILKFRIKCHLSDLNVKLTEFKSINETFTELTIDCNDLNKVDEMTKDVTVIFNDTKMKLECRILAILPFKSRKNLKIQQIKGFSLENRDNSYLIGHRGLGKNTKKPFLENTINSFNQCAQYGLDFVELDVHFTKDNEAIVFHDFFMDPENSIGTDDLIINLTYDQIKLRLGPSKEFGQFPTLDQVMKGVDPKIGMMIEFKFPQLTTDGKMEHQSKSYPSNHSVDYMPKNYYVDTVLNIIFENLIKKPRNIILLSFDADIALMLKLKQDLFPVFICTRGRLFNDDTVNHADSRINTFFGTKLWAQFCNLNGIVSRFYESLLADYLQSKKFNLKNFVYGDIPQNRKFIEEAKILGLDGLILDEVSELFHREILN